MADTNGINGSGSNSPVPQNIGLTRSSDNGVVSTNQNPLLLEKNGRVEKAGAESSLDAKAIVQEIKKLTELAKQYTSSNKQVPNEILSALKEANDKMSSVFGDASSLRDVLGKLNGGIGMFSRLADVISSSAKTLESGGGKETVGSLFEVAKELKSLKKDGSGTKELIESMDDIIPKEYDGIKQAFSEAATDLIGSGKGGGLFDGLASFLSEKIPVDDVRGEIATIAKIVMDIFGAVTNIMRTVESRMTMVVDAQAELSAYLQTLSDVPGSATFWEHIHKAMGGSGTREEVVSLLLGPGGSVVNSILDSVLGSFGMSDGNALQGTGLMTYEEYLNSMKTIVKTGYLKDLESRTFIAAMKEQLLPTFSETNATLYRILRLVDSGNSNSTHQRLAIQSYLTRYLNQYYEDSEYIQSQFSSIEAALLDSIAVKGSDKAIGNEETLTYESTVQAWTAALYASGVSSGVISNIAKGIDYLASGNIEALSQNESIMNFFAIAAAKSELSIAEMLINGLDNSDIYSMMETIVRYLSDISSSSNNVVRSEYAKIFGMSVADMIGVQNFVEGGGLSALLETKPLSERGATSTEFSEQLHSLFNLTSFGTYKGSRIPVQSYLANMIDNALTDTALKIGNNLSSYASYKLADVVSSIADVVSIVYPKAKIVSIIAKLSKYVSVFSQLTSSVGNAGVRFLTGAFRDGFAADTYNKLTGQDVALGGYGMLLAKSSAALTSAITSANSTINSKSLSETNSMVSDMKESASDAEKNVDSYIQEQKEKSSAEIIESSTDEESVVRIGMFNSDALSQLRRAISEVLENAGIISTGSSSSLSEGQSSVQSMLVSDRNAKIADLVHSINDSIWEIAQNLSTKEGDNIGQMLKEIASDVDTMQRDVDGVADNMALVTNKYIMS